MTTVSGILCVAFIINASLIELSLTFECLPNGEPIPDVQRREPLASPTTRNSSAESTLPAAGTPLRIRSRSPPVNFTLISESNSMFDSLHDIEPLPNVHDYGPTASSSRRNNPPESTYPAAERLRRDRCRRPPASSTLPPSRLPSFSGAGCELEELSFIRLISRVNHSRIFELRRYTFPMNKPLEMQIQKNMYTPMPIAEQIVVCTSDGDAFVLLETHDVLAGIYTYNIDRNKRRAKINTVTGTVTLLTKEEVTVVPVGARRTIAGCFLVYNGRLNPLHRS